MSTIRLSSMLRDARKKMGDVVYSKWKGINYTRGLSRPSGEPTEKQKSVRHAFGKLVKDWKQMNGVMHRSWAAYAGNKNLTGFNAFMGANAVLQKSGKPLELFSEMGVEPLMNFSASPGPAPGEIQCSFLHSEGPPGKHVTFFTQKKENGTADGKFRRYDGGAGTPSPFTVTGLEPGMEYFVYAVATEAAYPEATACSASESALCAAKA